MKKLMLVLLTTLLAMPAQAHYLWMERDDSGPARVYFGEWHKNVYERSGGRLDNIRAAVVIAPAGGMQGSERRENHIEIVLRGEGDAAVVEAMAPRKSRQSDEVNRGVLLARAGRSEPRALLELDLVPQEAGSNTFTLTFRGAPVPKASINVYGPPRWQKEFTTDDNGKVTLETPWAGRYVVEFAHIDEQPGEVDGGRFDKTRYGLTLTFVAAGGQPWPGTP